jgi:2-isopropylmalate synthase
MKARLYLYDTTLRDGAQTMGVNFSLEDKLQVAQTLDALGLDYIEGGYPGANPTDTALFSEPRSFSHAKLSAFGMTKRAGRSADSDPGFATLLRAPAAQAVCLVAKTWVYHVNVALGISPEENLESIAQSTAAVVAAGREALIDCEHFFDGYKDNPEYALACARMASEAGARWIVLCDTNGGTMPDEVEAIVARVVASGAAAGGRLGIHCHNDTENAVANSLAAVRAGARQIQGSLNGLGERCGNANFTSIIPTLLLKPPFKDRFVTGVTGEALKGLTAASRMLDEVLNRAPNRNAPYVGEAAFAHKGGIHVSAVQKDPLTYEHIAPETVGNRRKFLVSNQAGRSNILAELDHLGIAADKDDPRILLLLEEVKRREAAGYAYEGADASFDLLARRTLGHVPSYFDVVGFRVLVERRHNALGQLTTVSEATVKVRVDGETVINVGEGAGPVHALDCALRKDLGVYQNYIRDIELVDYKVRILTGGTEAVTRVLIESRDKGGRRRWFTVGVSANIVDASFEALIDSMTYKLFHDGAPAPGAE